MNPLIPGPVDVVMGFVALAAIAFVVAALVSWAGQVRQLDLIAAVGWIAVILCVPVAGPLTWFLLGRSNKDRRQPVVNGQ